MPLEQRDKELAAIGASIGANCRPCIEHHLAAGRDAGLSREELDDAVTTAYDVRRMAAHLLEARIAVLLGHRAIAMQPAPLAATSTERELVALGASVGANAHALVDLHVIAALDAGLAAHQIRSALKMAGYVQSHAASITGDEVARVLDEHGMTVRRATA